MIEDEKNDKISYNILKNLVRIFAKDQFAFIFAHATLAIFQSLVIFTSKYIIGKREDLLKLLRQLMQVFYLQIVYFGTRDDVREERQEPVRAQIYVRKIAKIFIAERPFTFWRRRITRSILRRYFIFLKRLLVQSGFPPPTLLAFA